MRDFNEFMNRQAKAEAEEFMRTANEPLLDPKQYASSINPETLILYLVTSFTEAEISLQSAAVYIHSRLKYQNLDKADKFSSFLTVQNLSFSDNVSRFVNAVQETNLSPGFVYMSIMEGFKREIQVSIDTNNYDLLLDRVRRLATFDKTYSALLKEERSQSAMRKPEMHRKVSSKNNRGWSELER